ncbi:MAG: hypothetical protein OXJ52_06250, partial [Oligoflexia bacterium]|nr:hypothetical protein [Oligoflexia bacterium]
MLKKEINPFGTYLYVDYFTDDKAETATALLLKEMLVKEKDKIELSFYSPTNDVNQILAVFSNSSGEFIPFKEELISPTSPHTKYSKITTDIPYDFGISSDKCLALTVPSKADRLFFSLRDSFFSNNKGININVKANKVLFQIKEKTIYQAVDSPKIDLKRSSETFDLVRNKTAVLNLVYEKIDDTPSSQVFKPFLKINGKSYKPKCLGKVKEIDCDFTLSAFDKRGLLEQTIILPMREKEALNKKGSFRIDFGFEDKNCKSAYTSYSFRLNIHETRKLQMGFTLIGGASSQKWKSFINDSLLDFDLLKRIYPVPDIGKNIPQWIILNKRLKVDKTLNKNKANKNVASASKEKIVKLREKDLNKSSSLLKDLTELKKMRIRQQLDKLFAVAGRDYFESINKENAAGFVVFTDSGSSTENVGFIRLDQGGTGTILHELGHLLGQLNEFYQKSSQNLSANDVCHFKGRT